MILEHAEWIDPRFRSRRRASSPDGIVDVAFFQNRRETVDGWRLRWSSPTAGVIQLIEQHYRSNMHSSFEFMEPNGTTVRAVYSSAPKLSATSAEVDIQRTNFT